VFAIARSDDLARMLFQDWTLAALQIRHVFGEQVTHPSHPPMMMLRPIVPSLASS